METSKIKDEDEITTKCAKCSRKARKGCTQSVCLKCCTDREGCTVHKEQREQAAFRDQVFHGTTDVQLALQDKRSKLIVKGRFRETGFTYMGDTVVIWNLREYLDNPKWKEEALRKSTKRRSRDERMQTLAKKKSKNCVG